MREFYVPAVPLLTPVESAERLLADAFSQTSPDQGTLITFRGMPGAGVDRVLQTALEYAREHEWLDFFVTLVPWEHDVPYSALERVCLKMVGLRHLLPDLVPDRDPIELGRRVLQALDAHFDVDDRTMLMVFDHLECCDPMSSVVFRYIVMRATARGANFVLGDSLAYPIDLGDELRQMVYTEPNAHLVILPEWSAEDIVTYVGHQVGSGVAVGEGERIRQLTGGRYEAVRLYLNNVSEDHLEDLGRIRTLPTVTSARMPPAPWPTDGELSEITRLAAEVCALQPDGVSVQKLKLVSNRVGVTFTSESVADGGVVIMNSLTGMLHLYDPLSAPDILERADPERVRIIHSGLADLTFGNESRIHELLSWPEIDAVAVAKTLETAADLEDGGYGQETLDLLDVAIERAQESGFGNGEYRALLRKFGHVFLRQSSPLQYQGRISDFAKFTDDAEFMFIYLWLRTVKAHGRLDARDARLAYLEGPPENIDHEFMQAEVSRMELLSALQTGPEATIAAVQDTVPRYAALVGKTPDNPELRWIDPGARLLFIEALVFVFGVSAGNVAGSSDEARQLAQQARALPDDSTEAVDVLTLAALVLGGRGDRFVDEASEIILEAKRRLKKVSRTMFVRGQLDVVDLDLTIRRGDWQEARANIDEAFVRAFDGLDMPTRIAIPALKAWLLAAEGHLDEAERYLTVAKEADQYRYPGYGIEMLPVTESQLAMARKGPQAALELLEAATPEPRYLGSLRIRGARIEILAAMGRFDEALPIWQEIEQIEAALAFEGPSEYSWLGAVEPASRGDIHGTVAIFERGAREARSSFTAAKCHLALANLYARVRGQRDLAREEFAAAREGFHEVGATAYIADAEAQVKRFSSENQRRMAELTRREIQVARLAARGWRNKEIARELNIGVATVAFHMSNALEKLGVSKRSELPSDLE
ncbi:LuxR C-terminal-related transcriptional regulator [Gulosibacter molinativorax]|uniref:DNA-binding response regulator n=1 Tax=Gulosibacter molinativorax TaxID=256821 RepID=A0ABT7C9U1_9MICO|nr:LuxR C-terminal-related transcriptional regulator [Gulosibacter molinativorax]MDJ1371978.1 DNA-binding response regulator [Gulosibacter molinativorax]QUY62658.1 Hypotetical protein [Gulosibacter molinativorax]